MKNISYKKVILFILGARDANIRLISRADILQMLELQQQTARRDSLINSMNQKQK